MKRIATFRDPKGRVTGLVHGPDFIKQSVTVGGRVWHFDFDLYCGPLWTRKNGEPFKSQMPPKAVWREFEKWLALNVPKPVGTGTPIKLEMGRPEAQIALDLAYAKEAVSDLLTGLSVARKRVAALRMEMRIARKGALVQRHDRNGRAGIRAPRHPDRTEPKLR